MQLTFAILCAFIIVFFGFSAVAFENEQAEEKAVKLIEKIAAVKGQLSNNQKKVEQTFWSDVGVSADEEIDATLRQKRQVSMKRGVEVVRIEISAIVTPGLIEFININGGHVLFSSERFKAITAEVPSELIERLAARDDVSSIKSPDAAKTNKLNSSNGRFSHRVSDSQVIHPQYQGQGIKIGVLSDSVDHLATVQASGDLPQVTVLPGQTGTGSGEGTAMLEIVHDLAPQASLYFASAFISMASFAQNILDLAAAGCKVIVDDVIYYGEPAFEDGIVAQAVETVAAKGVAYFSSAGNTGNLASSTSSTYEADYKGVPWSTLHPSTATGYQDCHSFSSTLTYNTITGKADVVVLHWSDSFNAPQTDYDLFVFDNAGNLVASSTGYQSAMEWVSIPNSSPTSVYKVVVARYSGPATKFISLRTFSGKFSFSTNGATYGHATAANAFGVGAVRATTSALASIDFASRKFETFSSEGPRKIFFESNTPVTAGNLQSTGGKLRQKPDFCAVDGVATATPGFSTFFGTSAAAPHLAAVAAVVFSANPTLSNNELRNIFKASAVPVYQQNEWNTICGGGVPDALASVELAIAQLAKDAPQAPTQAPTTQAPTTQAPTTQAPTTQAPTTQAPTTQAPTQAVTCPPQAAYAQANWFTAPGNSWAVGQCTSGRVGTPLRFCQSNGVWSSNVQNICTVPTTQAPTQAPTTQAPTTQAPTTQAPTTQAPTTQAPTTQAPTTQAPTTQVPTQAPGALIASCPPQVGYAHANWSTTSAGSWSVGVCQTGWTGKPLRFCQADGTWAVNVQYICKAV